MSCRLAILVSGSGTNLQAIIDAVRAGTLPAEIALVLSNRPGVKALERAAAAEIPQRCIPHQDFPNRAAFEDALCAALDEVQPDGIVLAGFDRVLSPEFVRRYPHRIFNIHPALLPAFPGLHAARQALAYGVKVTGVTVHFVDEGTDTGPIILQETVPIHPTDTEESLLERLHAVEHRLFPEALRLFAAGRLKIDGRQVNVV